MVQRRAVLLSLSGAVLAPLAAWAQQAGRRYRVGCLSSFPLPPGGRTPFLDTLEDGLRALGFVPGSNLSLVYRSPLGWGQAEALRTLAAELVGMRSDVLIAIANPAIEALSRETGTIPVVMLGARDPVGNGFVRSLSRPETNMTGLVSDIGFARQLEVLKELAPRVSRVAVLRDPTLNVGTAYLKDAEAAAARQGVSLLFLEIERADHFESAFRTAARERVEALVLWDSLVFYTHTHVFMDLLRESRLPLLASRKEYVELGALASYGADSHALFRQTAGYVARILNGAKPADLAVERPGKLELVIDRRVANALGLTIPSTLLLWADQVNE